MNAPIEIQRLDGSFLDYAEDKDMSDWLLRTQQGPGDYKVKWPDGVVQTVRVELDGEIRGIR